MDEREELKKRIDAVRASIGPGVTLLAATKTVSADRINEAIACGVDAIGENRVQELLEKYDSIDHSSVPVHFIGRLQTNKVKYIVDKVDMIQSLDSLKLAEEIEKRCAAIGKVMDCLVEINVGEASKGGVPIDEADGFVRSVSAFPHINVRGLMAVPPKYGENEKKLQCFRKIYQKFIDIRHEKVDNSNMDILSVGMSDDYMQAVACGSNMVRMGTAIFGERKPK